METKLCRICGKLGQNFMHIFKTEGLKNKIETCLPIIVSQHCLLPDTICGECSENVDNFYSFIKNCLQNIIILEAQYDITESCLKTKRKFEKGCQVDLTTASRKVDKNIQTDDYLDVLLGKPNDFEFDYSVTSKIFGKDSLVFDSIKRNNSLVDYDIDSDTNSENEDNSNSKVTLGHKLEVMNKIHDYVDSVISPKNSFASKHYFDDPENNLISEISQRKCQKRKMCFIENRCPKIFKMDTSNRRKSKQPKKLDFVGQNPEIMASPLSFGTLEMMVESEGNHAANSTDKANDNFNDSHTLTIQNDKDLSSLPQTCLLCDSKLAGAAALATHVFETHGIDMAEIVSSSEASSEKKKKIPKLVKICDLKKNDTDDNQFNDQLMEEPPTLSPSFVCPNCPAVFSTKPDLFVHLRIKHTQLAGFLCGICLHQANTYLNLKAHLELCSQHHTITNRYICQVCLYGDDNFKSMESHVLVHGFLLEACKKQTKMFDPADYIDTNEDYNFEGASPLSKSLNCSECGLNNFDSFKDFSTHRRNQHSIFHCDLCNKFYGRNSHLWKHVNRLHKGHPSITCQLCYKTSASKYHLAQHFNKIHSAKNYKQKVVEPVALPVVENNSEDFMSQKFQGFDFQSVKQSFMKQEIIDQERRNNAAEVDDNSNNRLSDQDDPDELLDSKIDVKKEPLSAPKEIDSSSDLYTNIITNYTPPANEGEFKCPKCGKGFHKKTLLKKHKKNCRPRLQKDLLTRCKSCARIFKDRQSLAKHLVNYHSEYACEICQQKVQSKCEIVSHIRFTHPGCHLVCKICGNILRSQNDLLEHTRDHLNSYICQFCADALPSKIKLKMHILSLHRKILSLSCGVCLKLFETQHILRDHVKLVHKDQLAPLTSCPVCGKNYGSKWKTYDHLNKSHGRIFRACKTCLEVFDNELQLQAHYETAHLSQGGSSLIKNNLNLIMPASNNIQIGNENNYDTESEQEHEDNSDEEDMEREKQHSDSEEHNKIIFNSFASLSNDTKISLLEKRLLGKKISEEELTPPPPPKINKIFNNFLPKPKPVIIEPPKPIVEIKKEKLLIEQPISMKEDEMENVVVNSPNPQHNSSKRTVYVNSNDPSYCEICLKTWPAKKHLWQHYIRCHKSVAATVCGICLKTNYDYATLQVHLIENHPTLLHGQGFGSNFICRICGRYHNASSKLKLHMAIHENFDWTLLDESKITNKPVKLAQDTNGFRPFQKMEPNDGMEIYGSNVDDINYESLIEQVECSSQSENDDSDEEETGNMEVKQEQDSSSDDEGETEENDSSDNSMESRMMNNMMHAKPVNCEVEDKAEEVIENYVSTSDDTSSSFSEDHNVEIKTENGSEGDISRDSRSISSHDKYTIRSNSTNTVDSITNSNIFRCKPEELDSAIKSISYECMDQVDDNVEDDFCDLQSHSLNENEIESAVGSIL